MFEIVKFKDFVRREGIDNLSQYTIYLNDDKTPTILQDKEDYESLFEYKVCYVIMHETLLDTTYDHVIRLLSPDYPNVKNPETH